MTEILTNLSNDLAETVERGAHGVVRIEARDRLPASGIVWPEHDLVVTAHHVVERDENIAVGLPGGETAEASLAGRDPTTDLAVLRVPGVGKLGAEFADTEGLRVGHLVLALGRPGQNVRAAVGIVGALGKSWRTPAGGSLDRYLQTDTVMYPGFSGGPLVDVSGRVLGLNTSAILNGVSITVPVATLRRVVDALHTHGRVRRGYLGVGVQPNRLPKELAENTGQETGLLLTSVEPGSPAAKGGLFLGDTIITVAGQPVRHLDDLMANLGGDRIGQTLLVSVLRAGQIVDVPVTPADQTPGDQT